ncbi:MAG: SPFH domain-containing protein [Fimbriimonadales bacterium]
MIPVTAIVIGVLVFILLIGLFNISKLICVCAPNEVLVFTGKRSRVLDRVYNYRVIKGGRGIRVPLLERVDRMDLTNMAIDLTAQNAYSKGGIPLTVQGVANLKVAGHEPVLNNAIERFLGKPREEIMRIAKNTLEGSLRGVLATLTPEEVNEDRNLFAERLVQEVEDDMTKLGLVVDTLKIQNVQDEVQYLNSIGRKKNAEIMRQARIAEAIAKADSQVRSAENREREVTAQIEMKVATAKAEAQKRLTDALTRRDAVVAEERATVAAAVAQAEAEVKVQNARVEQTKRRLEADVVQPAKANCEAAEASAIANASPILEQGRAQAEALKSLADVWSKTGSNAREVFLLQKLEPIVQILTGILAETSVEKLTIIDSKSGGDASLPVKAVATLEQIKQIFGVDVVQKLQSLGAGEKGGKEVKLTWDTPKRESE